MICANMPLALIARVDMLPFGSKMRFHRKSSDRNTLIGASHFAPRTAANRQLHGWLHTSGRVTGGISRPRKSIYAMASARAQTTDPCRRDSQRPQEPGPLSRFHSTGGGAQAVQHIVRQLLGEIPCSICVSLMGEAVMARTSGAGSRSTVSCRAPTQSRPIFSSRSKALPECAPTC